MKWSQQAHEHQLHSSLELQTTSFKRMFGETPISYAKISNHPSETTITNIDVSSCS